MTVGSAVIKIWSALVLRNKYPAKIVFGWVMMFSLAGSFTVSAQDFQVRSWFAENGLLNNTVRALAQTGDGSLWIGTPKGLIRFDGDSFKPSGTAGYTGTLEDSNVVGLAVDHAGSLWIASASGLITQFSEGGFHLRYRPSKTAPNDLKFTGLRFVSQDVAAENWRNLNSIFAMDEHGSLWAITITGEVIQFSGSNAPVTLPLTNFPAGQLLGLANDEAGRMWLLKGTNVCSYEAGHWDFSTLSGLSYFGKIFCPTPDGGFLMAQKTGDRSFANLVQKKNGHWQIVSTAIPADPLGYAVSAMLQDRRGRLWVAVPTEGIYMKPPKGDWIRVQVKGPLAKCVVHCLFEDEHGSIWVGTEEKGLHQVLDPLVQMVMLPPEASDVHLTTVCAARDGDIWMGTDKGLYRQKSGESGSVSEVREFHRQNVYTVLEDSQTNLWIGTKNGIFQRDGSGFKKILALTNGGVLALYEDRKGDIWAGGFQAIFHFHDGTNDFTCTPTTREKSFSICCLSEDAQGQIFAITRWTGLWEVRGQRLVKVESADPQTDPIAQMDAVGRVCAIYHDRENTLWLGTFGNGLFRWSNGRLRQFTIADGLPDNGILGLREDDQGNLWMSSRNGIFGCPRRQLNNYVRNQTAPLVCMQLGLSEGLADRECTGAGQPVISRGPDNRFWVATTVGAAGFSPATITKVVSTPEVTIETLNVDGRIMANTDARIPASARHFEFQYSAPELTTPQKLHFRYWLEGMDQTWTDAGASRVAIYNQLPAGKYRFRVMVCGEDGLWREAKNPIRLRVVPHFWQTWWFQTMCVVVVVIAIMGGVVLNLRRKAQRSLERLEIQQAIEQVRRRITRDLHDELGSSITEIIQLGELTLQPEPEVETLRSNVKNMVGLVTQLSVTVDEIVWTMNSRNDTLSNLVGYISNHAQEFFRHSNISCRLDVTKNLPNIVVDSQTRHNLFLAVKEALNNVAKHSGASQVFVRVHYMEGTLRISVEDNGKGFDPAASPAGEGLKNMQERLQMVKGHAEFLRQTAGGSKVIFTLDSSHFTKIVNLT